MRSNPLRQKLKVILETFDSLSRQNGVVEKDVLLSALYGKVEVDEAEDLISHLIAEGIIKTAQRGILEKP
jgi:hypothetical protein